MRFLTGASIQRHVSRIVRRTADVSAAVAYWGTGAAERTGMRKRNPGRVRVICDLLSGACNPSEIETLLGLGVQVRTLDRLHAKVWIAGDDVIIGSSNASKNGLPIEDDTGAGGNVEAAMLSRDPGLSCELQGWFDARWQDSVDVTDEHLAEAARLWRRRSKADRRAFARTLTQKLRNPQPSDRFTGLRIVAYRATGWSDQAERFLQEEAKAHYPDSERADLNGEAPFYEWPASGSEWAPGARTALMDFSCARRGGPFTFNGFWAVREGPSIPLTESRLTLLMKLADFNGHTISKAVEAELAKRVRRLVAHRGHHVDESGFYIDMDFLDFCEAGRAMLKARLIAQAVETAKELCRTGRFDSALTLHTIRRCKEDRDWLRDYSIFVGGGIYDSGNPLKRQINPDFGKRIRLAVGATNMTGTDGKPIRRPVSDEIIQWYTPFKKFSAASVGER